MVAELIDKYLWLIQTFIDVGERGLTLERLQDKWESRYGTPYPRRTFNNHRDAVADVFGIVIKCDRSTNTYYVESPEDALDSDKVTGWMVNSFTVNNLLTMSREKLRGRVSVENIPSGQKFLTTIMMAMEANRELHITYRPYGGGVDERLIRPYAVKEYAKRWYVIGFRPDEGRMRVYALDRIMALTQLESSFEMPGGFDVDEVFADSFGIYFPAEDKKPVVIRVAATPREANFLRDLPLHRSQTEVGEEDGRVIFAFRLIPDDNLFMELCKRGDRIEVLSPPDVRERVINELQKAINTYIK
ncbi:MAG: WYL domain-containing protein [Bacteroidales bacterium]|nr:WYL domain-containing protein [Bacteroidales bacterium]